MKQIYAILVLEKQMDAIERLLNLYRVGLNDWTKCRVRRRQGAYIKYCIMCTADTFESITNIVNEW